MLEVKTSRLFFLLSTGRLKCGNSQILRIVPNEGNAAAYKYTVGYESGDNHPFFLCVPEKFRHFPE